MSGLENKDVPSPEARFQAYVDALPHQIAVIDSNGRIAMVNSAWRRFARENGGNPARTGTGTDYLAACTADGSVRTRLQEVLAGGDGFAMEYPCHSPTERRWFLMTVAPIEDGSGGAIVSHVNITERREAEEKTARINRELETFTYAASHDMREPLRMIESYLTLLRRRLGPSLDEDSRTFLDFASDGARRLDQMILGLLDYARIGRGSQPDGPVDLNEILAEALANLDVCVRSARAVIDLSAPLPQVMGRRSELIRLLQNLIANAVKYHAPDRPPQVRIDTRRDGQWWEIGVSDNGVGIPAAQCDRVFGIFQRLHGPEVEGCGIGLANCRKVVEHHGGRIWVESTEGQGSTFLFTLPAAPP